MRYKIKYSFCLFLFLAFASGMKAQDTLSSIEVTVTTALNPTLRDAVKIDYNPQIDPPQLDPPKLTYAVEGKEYKTKPEIVPAKPQGYNSKDLERQYGNYTRIGYGMYKMPLFETYFNNTTSKKYDYGISFKHLNGEYRPWNQVFSDDKAEGKYAYNLSATRKLKVNAAYERHRINYFGFNHDSAKFDIDSTKNIYSKYGGEALFTNEMKRASDLGYSAGAGYYFMNDHYSNKESYFDIGGHVLKNIHNHPLTVPLKIVSTSFSHHDIAYSRFLIDVQPRYMLDYKRLVLNLGFNATIRHDTSDNNLFFYPYADFRMTLIEKRLKVHLGIDGRNIENTYSSMIAFNPFLDTAINLKNTNMKSKVMGGFEGSIGNHFAFAVEADFASYINAPFYLGDTTALRKYKVIYDNLDAFNLKGTLEYQVGEQFKSILEVGFHKYQPDGQAYYWNMPSLDAKLNLQYTYNNMITARLTTYYIGQRYGKNIEHKDLSGNTLDSAAIILPAFADVNVYLEYRYSKMISVFVNACNLTNQAYMRWNNYPSYKLNILGGVAFTF
jgi:hypothetical protein